MVRHYDSFLSSIGTGSVPLPENLSPTGRLPSRAKAVSRNHSGRLM